MKIPILAEFYKTKSSVIDKRECVNFYTSIYQNSSKTINAIVTTPGIRYIQQIGNGCCRGLFVTANDILIGVWGNKIYRLEPPSNATELGTIDSNFGRISFAENETQIMLVDGANGYIINKGDYSFVKITDDAFNPGSHVVFIGGFFVVNPVQHSGKFYYSALYNGLRWDELDFYTTESCPDKIQALIKRTNELWVFGSKSFEVWTLTGDGESPFSRQYQSYNEIGTVAPFSVQSIGDKIFWLGSNVDGYGIVWSVDGYMPVRVSTPPIEEEISKYKFENVYSFTCQFSGHLFYYIVFPENNKSFVYDLTTKLWHEQAYYNERYARYEEVGINTCVLYKGKLFCGSRANGNLFVIDDNYFYDDSIIQGTEIRRELTTGHIYLDMQRLYMTELIVDCEVGVGLKSGQGENPQLMLQWSDDGGKTWSNEYWKSIGKIGEYKTIVRWNRLGSAIDRVFRFTFSDPVRLTIANSFLEIAV